MKKFSFLNVLTPVLLVSFCVSVEAQTRFVLENPGKVFKTKDRREEPVRKSSYQFSVGDSTEREYLIQQDSFDLEGRIKSSGLFSQDGNKASDVRYTYDENGNLREKVVKHLKKNRKEISSYNEQGLIASTKHYTRTDSFIQEVKFVYDENGILMEEQYFLDGALNEKQVYDDTYNAAGRRTQQCHYKLDANGARKPHNAEMIMTEYDPDGLILQLTKYNNKEKRKMLSWIYYKYQLDNNYKVIKQSGYDEEQTEVYRNELTYTDSSIISAVSEICNCPEKNLQKTEERELVFNAYGEKVRELIYTADMALTSTKTWKYDDFGNEIEFLEVLADNPKKLIKSKQILTFRTDQAQSARKK